MASQSATRPRKLIAGISPNNRRQSPSSSSCRGRAGIIIRFNKYFLSLRKLTLQLEHERAKTGRLEAANMKAEEENTVLRQQLEDLEWNHKETNIILFDALNSKKKSQRKVSKARKQLKSRRIIPVEENTSYHGIEGPLPLQENAFKQYKQPRQQISIPSMIEPEIQGTTTSQKQVDVDDPNQSTGCELPSLELPGLCNICQNWTDLCDCLLSVEQQN